jgi:hypothetical protein
VTWRRRDILIIVVGTAALLTFCLILGGIW